MPRADQVVALGGEEVEPLHLLGVLLHRQRVHRADRLQRADDARGLGFERLEVQVERRGLLHELLERPPPFRLDALEDAAPGAGGLREPDLEAVALLARGVQRAPRAGHLALRAGQRRLRIGQLGIGVGARGLELLERYLALGPRLAPLGLLRRERRGVGLELGQLAAQGQRDALGLVARRAGPLQAVLRRAEPAGHVRLLHLPVHPLLARGLLL